MIVPLPRDVPTTLPYLARDELYRYEKPFQADHTVIRPDGIPFANHKFHSYPVTVLDIRGQPKPSLDQHGFCFIKTQTTLAAAEADDARTPAMMAYLDEIERLLYDKFPHYSRIEVLDFGVRRRSPDYPHNINGKAVFEQPAALPHSDFSKRGAFLHMSEGFPGQERLYRDKDFDLLNVWRVLIGPNDDWPLALCDFESVDLEHDVLENDCLHHDNVGENQLLLPNTSHRWYYLSAQEEDDLIVFRNTDSKGRRACSFHAAFKNPLAKGPPRQSIEVRVVAFR